MRIGFIIAAIALLAGCMFGDPRTTEIENKSGHSISVSFTDGAFNMGGKVEIEPNSTGNLAPNYEFSELKMLKIVEGRRLYEMQC